MATTRVRLKRSRIVDDKDCVNIDNFAKSTWGVLCSTAGVTETIICIVNEKDIFEITDQDAYYSAKSMFPKAEYFRIPKKKVFY